MGTIHMGKKDSAKIGNILLKATCVLAGDYGAPESHRQGSPDHSQALLCRPPVGAWDKDQKPGAMRLTAVLSCSVPELCWGVNAEVLFQRTASPTELKLRRREEGAGQQTQGIDETLHSPGGGRGEGGGWKGARKVALPNNARIRLPIRQHR